MILYDELEESGVLRHFSPASQPRVASMAQLEEVSAETRIFSQGQRSGQVYFVLEGEVALEMKGPDRDSIVVHQVGQGGLLGWSAVLHSGPRTATARALTPCRLAALDAAEVRALTQQSPQFARDVLQVTAEALGDRLRAMRGRLSDARHEPHALKEGAD